MAPALSLLPAIAPPPNHVYNMQNLTPEQRQKIKEDLADRERQASALAAAGALAESVSLTTPSVGQALHDPSTLGGIPPPSSFSAAGGNPPLSSIDWNMEMEGGVGGQSFGLDDLDMDFATLFDAESELNLIGGGENTPTGGTGAPDSAPAAASSIATQSQTPNQLNGGSAAATGR